MNSENPESTLTASRGLGGKRLGEISELNPILCILTFAFFAFFCGKMFLLKITEGVGFSSLGATRNGVDETSAHPICRRRG